MKTARILVADDHEMVRVGVRTIITPHKEWSICGEATNGRAAVEMAAQLRPDIVIMDLAMPQLNGLEATRQIHRAQPRAEILVLTFDESESLIREVIQAGARGYVLKTDLAEMLVQAVETLSQHRPYFTPKAAEVLLHARLGPGSDARPPGAETPLTARERQIVQMVAEGGSTKEVAESLHISVKTAENHRANIMRKLKVKSVSDLVRYAIRNKIISV